MDYLCDSINALFKSPISSMFPNSLKPTVITPLHKKGRKELKEVYRSVSILPTLSKMFDRIMFAQISTFFDNVFPNFNADFGEAILLHTTIWKC